MFRRIDILLTLQGYQVPESLPGTMLIIIPLGFLSDWPRSAGQ